METSALLLAHVHYLDTLEAAVQEQVATIMQLHSNFIQQHAVICCWVL